MPKLSIITVNFNNVAGLQKTLESVFDQSWQGFEHIIIDGGSTDGSFELIQKNQAKFSHWVSEQDHGVYHAMNKGIKVANGEYLLFLNSGDHFYSKNTLKDNHLFLKKFELIYFNQKVIGETKEFIKQYPDKLSFAYFLKDNLPHQATFISKKTIIDYGLFDENLKIVSDWRFFIDSVCQNNVSYCSVNKVLICFYLGGISSQSESQKIINQEKEAILLLDYNAYRKDLDEVLKNIAIIHTLRRSRIIRLLINLGFLNKF